MISVIVCTYNREKFIGSALESLANQTFDKKNYEVLVINNNCTDNTAAIIDTFIEAHNELQIRHIQELQQGLSYARNRGIREAQFEQLIFIDDDAIAAPKFIETINSYLLETNFVAGGGQVIAKFETSKPNWYNKFSASMFCSEHTRGRRNTIYKSGDYPFGCNMIFQKKIFDEVGLFNVELGRKGKNLLGGEEKDIFTKIQNSGKPVFYLADAKVLHCIDDYRLANEYVDKLSISLGKTHRYLHTAKGSVSFVIGALKMISKFFAALILAFGYSLMLRFSVGKHLIRWRYLTMKSYFQK